MKNFGLQLADPRKCNFFSILTFSFIQLSNGYCQKCYDKTTLVDFQNSYKFSPRHKFLWSTRFWQWNNDAFKFFWNLHGDALCFFSFCKWKKYYNLILMIHLKHAIVHYTNFTSSSIIKPFLNYGSSNMLFYFLHFLNYTCFKDAFIKNFNENYHLLIQLFKIHLSV